MPSIPLGATFTDTVTRFIGVAIAHTDYLGGTSRTLLQSRVDRPGGRPSAEWFDDARLEHLQVEPVVRLTRPACTAPSVGAPVTRLGQAEPTP